MTTSDLIPHIEALIFASDKPLTTLEITDVVNSFPDLEEKISLDKVEAALNGIVEKYSAEFHKTVAQLNGDKFLKRLSAAALETLAIIAYKQPVTKGEIESIRGVSCDYAIQKLLEKELIIISGRNEHAPGQPLLYATSKTFMDYFGINTSDDLPKLKEIIAEQVEATLVKAAEEKNEEAAGDDEVLSVAEDGELVVNNSNEN